MNADIKVNGVYLRQAVQTYFQPHIQKETYFYKHVVTTEQYLRWCLKLCMQAGSVFKALYTAGSV